jgi:hypothetical protein
MPKIHRVLAECVSPETAHVQQDYPYGRRLRCQRRCWLEYRVGFGFRFCTQTTNPKREGLVWNAVKESTYTPLAALCLTDEHTNDKGEPVSVEWFTPGPSVTRDSLECFMAAFGEALGEDQLAAAKALATSRYIGCRKGHRFLVFDAATGEQLTPEPVTAADPIFAAHLVVRPEKGHSPSLDAISERDRVGLLESRFLGKQIRVEYVDTIPLETGGAATVGVSAPAAAPAA